jgi:hypothetical protein
MLPLGNLPFSITAESASVTEADAQQQEREGHGERLQQAAAVDSGVEPAVLTGIPALASLPPTVANLVIRHWQLKVVAAVYDDDLQKVV